MNGARRLSLLAAWACVFGAPVMPCAEAADRVVEQLMQAVKTSRTLSQHAAPYDAVFRRDPMRPLVDGQGQWVSSSGLSSGLSVQGIVWSDQRPLVIVDDELYAPGAVIGPYTIVEIKEQGVTVERGGVQLLILLDRGLPAVPNQEPAPHAASTNSPSP